MLAPFKSNVTGADISKYSFHEALRNIAHPEVFTSQVNGVVGGLPLVEDFFVVLLCGFDIVDIDVKTLSIEPAEASGTLRIAHRRTFLGWRPPSEGESIMDVPLYMRGEAFPCNGEKLSHLTMRCPFAEALRERRCPEGVSSCLTNPDALKMLVTLRRARVKPEIISERALLSASRKQERWCSALGML